MIDEDEMRQALQPVGQDDVALDEIYKIIGNDDKNEISFTPISRNVTGIGKERHFNRSRWCRDGSHEEDDSIEKAQEAGNQGSKEDDSTEKSVEMTSVTIENSLTPSYGTVKSQYKRRMLY